MLGHEAILFGVLRCNFFCPIKDVKVMRRNRMWIWGRETRWASWRRRRFWKGLVHTTAMGATYRNHLNGGWTSMSTSFVGKSRLPRCSPMHVSNRSWVQVQEMSCRTLAYQQLHTETPPQRWHEANRKVLQKLMRSSESFGVPPTGILLKGRPSSRRIPPMYSDILPTSWPPYILGGEDIVIDVCLVCVCSFLLDRFHTSWKRGRSFWSDDVVGGKLASICLNLLNLYLIHSQTVAW